MNNTYIQPSLFNDYEDEIVSEHKELYVKCYDDPLFNVKVDIDIADEASNPAELALEKLGYFLVTK